MRVVRTLLSDLRRWGWRAVVYDAEVRFLCVHFGWHTRACSAGSDLHRRMAKAGRLDLDQLHTMPTWPPPPPYFLVDRAGRNWRRFIAERCGLA